MPLPSVHKPILLMLYVVIIGLGALCIDQSDFFSIHSFVLPGFLLALYFSVQALSFKNVLLVGLFVRLVTLFTVPSLSDDFYRFIWDGMLVVDGYNPYIHTPREILPILSDQAKYLPLFTVLNSPDYYSVYPPLSQAIFTFSAWLSGPSPYMFQFILGSVFIAADLCLVIFLYKITAVLNQDSSWIALYFLNPYVVYEFSGNLHTDLLLSLGLVLCLYSILRSNYSLALCSAVCASAIKPQFILFLPLLFLINYPLKKHQLKYVIAYGALLLLLYAPFLLFSDSLGFDESLDLYFRNFEFNGSIYLGFRWIGYQIYGYNAISLIGPLLAVMAGLSIATVYLRSFNHRSCFSSIDKLKIGVAIFTIYILFSTTVHPWYILPMLVLAVFTRQRWVILWSYTIMWSYAFYDPQLYPWSTMISLLGYSLPFALLLLDE